MPRDISKNKRESWEQISVTKSVADPVTGLVTIVTTSGKVGGIIDLGTGNDTFNGGANAETVKDGDGADVINLRGGNDIYIATGNTGIGQDGIDTINGGGGIDTYDASGSAGFVNLNFGTVARPGVGAGTAVGPNVDDSSGTTHDNVINFENAIGGSGADTFYGSETANRFDGGGNDDHLLGFGGK